MLILFPRNSTSPATIDPEFGSEHDAARRLGFETALYDHAAVASGRLPEASLIVPDQAPSRRVLLRGWMLSGERYAAFHARLMSHGLHLVTSPEAYEESHYLPNAYPHIEHLTARSAWIEGDDVDRAWDLYQSFRDRDAVMKDWVKSAKSRWRDGCFISAGATEERFREVFRVFRSTRGRLFNRGVVLREFMPVVHLGNDLRGLPMIDETRLFFWHGKLLVRPVERSPSPLDELATWTAIAGRFQSPFLSIDVVRLTDESWRIVEVGDGGVSGLPMGLTPSRFYECLGHVAIAHAVDRSV